MRRTVMGEIDAREALREDEYEGLYEEDSQEEGVDISADLERVTSFDRWLKSDVAPHCPFLSPDVQLQLTVCFCDDLGDLANEKAGAVFRPFDNRVLACILPLSACPDRHNLNLWLRDQNDNHFGIWMTAFHPERLTEIGIPLFEEDSIIVLMQDLNALHMATTTILKETPHYYDPQGKSPSRMEAILDASARARAYETWSDASRSPLTTFALNHDATVKWLTDKETN